MLNWLLLALTALCAVITSNAQCSNEPVSCANWSGMGQLINDCTIIQTNCNSAGQDAATCQGAFNQCENCVQGMYSTQCTTAQCCQSASLQCVDVKWGASKKRGYDSGTIGARSCSSGSNSGGGSSGISGSNAILGPPVKTFTIILPILTMVLLLARTV